MVRKIIAKGTAHPPPREEEWYNGYGIPEREMKMKWGNVVGIPTYGNHKYKKGQAGWVTSASRNNDGSLEVTATAQDTYPRGKKAIDNIVSGKWNSFSLGIQYREGRKSGKVYSRDPYELSFCTEGAMEDTRFKYLVYSKGKDGQEVDPDSVPELDKMKQMEFKINSMEIVEVDEEEDEEEDGEPNLSLEAAVQQFSKTFVRNVRKELKTSKTSKTSKTKGEAPKGKGKEKEKEKAPPQAGTHKDAKDPPKTLKENKSILGKGAPEKEQEKSDTKTPVPTATGEHKAMDAQTMVGNQGESAFDHSTLQFGSDVPPGIADALRSAPDPPTGSKSFENFRGGKTPGMSQSDKEVPAATLPASGSAEKPDAGGAGGVVPPVAQSGGGQNSEGGDAGTSTDEAGTDPSSLGDIPSTNRGTDKSLVDTREWTEALAKAYRVTTMEGELEKLRKENEALRTNKGPEESSKLKKVYEVYQKIQGLEKDLANMISVAEPSEKAAIEHQLNFIKKHSENPDSLLEMEKGRFEDLESTITTIAVASKAARCTEQEKWGKREAEYLNAIETQKRRNAAEDRQMQEQARLREMASKGGLKSPHDSAPPATSAGGGFAPPSKMPQHIQDRGAGGGPPPVSGEKRKAEDEPHGTPSWESEDVEQYAFIPKWGSVYAGMRKQPKFDDDPVLKSDLFGQMVNQFTRYGARVPGFGIDQVEFNVTDGDSEGRGVPGSMSGYSMSRRWG